MYVWLPCCFVVGAITNGIKAEVNSRAVFAVFQSGRAAVSSKVAAAWSRAAYAGSLDLRNLVISIHWEHVQWD
ncbi:MAG: hypothetical protein AB7W47_04840 [Calditrichaceae bacterium]